MRLNPDDFDLSETVITPRIEQYGADSLSLRRNRRGKNVHRYEIELTTPPEPLNTARRVAGRINGILAHMGTVEFIHPLQSNTQGTEPAGGLSVVGNYAAGSNRITLNGATHWQLFAGDYIQFTGQKKVYELAEDTQLAKGQQQVTLVSPLLTDLNEVAATVNSVCWHLIPEEAMPIELAADDGRFISHTLTLIEDLS